MKISPKQRLLIILLVFSVFIIMLASLFIFNLVDIEKKGTFNANLVNNSGFERWSKGKPIGWEKTNAFVFDESTSIVNGEHAVGIYAREDIKGGLYQTINLEPAKLYNVCFSLKSNSYYPDDAGVEITYEGDNVKASVDIKPGIHFYDGKNTWRQYYGKVTGAKSISLFFFAKNTNQLFVDAVGVGINLPTATVNATNYNISEK